MTPPPSRGGNRKPQREVRPGREARPRREMPPGREARPPRSRRPDVEMAPATTGRPIVVASWAGTAALLVTAVTADIWPHPFDLPAVVVALALFFGGIVAFLWAYAVAVSRSREDEISLPGVFALSGTAPPAVRAHLLGSVAAQGVIAVATASTRLYSTLSFGVLAVLWGLGLAGLWGARYGAFPPRAPATGRGRGPR